MRRLALAALAVAGVARAEDRIDFKTSYFLEPAPSQTLHVVHPQLDVNIDAGRVLSVRVGYDADVVTGATPRTYGSIDAVSAATSFSDVRHAVHGGIELRGGPMALDAGYTYAFEHDYRSHAVDASARVDLWGKNTTFLLGYSHNFDSVCDANNQGAKPLERKSLATSTGCFQTGQLGLTVEPLAIDSYAGSWTQVLAPTIVGDLSLAFQVLDGFQSNPYRRVRLFSGAVEAQESEPLLRERVALQARARFAVPKLHAAIGTSARLYWDTWDVKSITAEVAWEQYLGTHVVMRVRGRFYQQTRALFYRDAGETLSYESVGPVGQYFTGDRELAPIRDWLVGVKLAYLKSADERGKVLKLFEDLDLNVKLDVVDYVALTPQPPNLPRFQTLFGLISAFLLQAGVSLRW